MKKHTYMLMHPPDGLGVINNEAEELKRQRSAKHDTGDFKAVTIGIWDLGAWLGGLSSLIQEINSTQMAFIFFEIKAAVAVGLISRPKLMISWLTNALNRKLEQEEIRDIKNNLIADDFFMIAESIRRDLNIDYILGITPSMVAGLDEDEVYWNHFSTFSKRTILASSYQLREYADETGLPFNAFLVCIIYPQLLTAMFYPDLGFHPDNNCLFDYDSSRSTIKNKVKNPTIEKSCMNLIRKPYRQATKDILNFIKNLDEG